MVLFCQQFGGRHESDLIAGSNGVQCRARRDQRLPGADVALDQPQHGVCLHHVGRKLSRDALLSSGWCERQPRQKRRGNGRRRGDLRCRMAPLSVSDALHGELMSN